MRLWGGKMKTFNVTAQVYKNNDSSRQNLFINEIVDGDCLKTALSNFNLHFPCIEYTLVKIYSIEEV